MANPTIVSSVNLRNSTAGISFNQTFSEIAGEESSSVETRTISATAAIIDVGTINNPKSFAFANIGTTESVLISFDDVSYDIEVQPDDLTLIRLRNSDKVEKQTVETVADVALSLDGKYFVVDGDSGTWGVWFDVDNSGTAEPAHGATNSAKVSSIIEDDTAAAVANAIFVDLSNDTAFTADFELFYDSTVDDDLITIVDRFTGNRTDISAGTSGFTVAKTQDGGTGRSVYAKTTAGDVECLIAIMPN